MTIDTLRKLAQEAQDYDEGRLLSFDAEAFRAACTPAAILALCEVAEAAKALLPILDEHLFERGPEEDALRAALGKVDGGSE